MKIETANHVQELLKKLKLFEMQLDEINYLEAEETSIEFSQETTECEMIINTNIYDNIEFINVLIEKAKEYLTNEIANIKREINNL